MVQYLLSVFWYEYVVLSASSSQTFLPEVTAQQDTCKGLCSAALFW